MLGQMNTTKFTPVIRDRGHYRQTWHMSNDAAKSLTEKMIGQYVNEKIHRNGKSKTKEGAIHMMICGY